MYGSSFCIVTRRPRAFSSRPSDEAVRPLPRELATPPVTKMCFATTLLSICALLDLTVAAPQTTRSRVAREFPDEVEGD